MEGFRTIPSEMTFGATTIAIHEVHWFKAICRIMAPVPTIVTFGKSGAWDVGASVSNAGKPSGAGIL